MYRKSYCTIPGINTAGNIGVGIGGGLIVSKMLNFYLVLCVGKELSGELSCM